MMILVAAALVVAGMSGCRATPAYQGGQRSVLATYRFRRLTADLPPTVRVQAVVAAARQALAHRGYAVTPGTTEDSGRVLATAPSAGMLESVEVSARIVPDGTRVEIIIDPLGNQVESRAILDAILARLGM